MVWSSTAMDDGVWSREGGRGVSLHVAGGDIVSLGGDGDGSAMLPGLAEAKGDDSDSPVVWGPSKLLGLFPFPPEPVKITSNNI